MSHKKYLKTKEYLDYAMKYFDEVDFVKFDLCQLGDGLDGRHGSDAHHFRVTAFMLISTITR